MKNNYVSLFGDLHNHCNISYGHGELREALENAQLQLDFVSITGHADWPDMDADNPEIAHIIDFHVKGFARLRKVWDHYQKSIEAFENEQGLVTFPGYEIHSNEHGDYTVVGYAQNFEITLAESPIQLREIFRYKNFPRTEEGNEPAVLMFPHHIGYRRGARGVNWKSFDEAYTPLVEINSMHGLADDDFSDRPSLHSMGPWQSYGTMEHGLHLGRKFGVMGNTDHHSGHPGSYGHGLTGVWAEEKNRHSIWSALQARRTWAMTGDKVRLWFSLADTAMGSLLSQSSLQDAVIAGTPGLIEVDSTAAIDYVELIVNGDRKQLWWSEPESEKSDTGGTDEVIVELELGWGERRKSTQWDVNIQVKEGRILETIPRFRGAEVVSPLDVHDGKGCGDQSRILEQNDHGIRFTTTSWGNTTNTTPSTQGMALRISNSQLTNIEFQMNQRYESWSLSKLLQGSRSGNLGPIDSPAYRIRAIPLQCYRWSIPWSLDEWPVGWIHTRVRLKNGHWAISSPIWIEE